QVPRRRQRPGLSLLEVLVSLAIFLLALVALSRLIGMGSDFARDAQQQTECTRLAQSKLNEVICGWVPLESQSDQEFEETTKDGQTYYWSMVAEQNPDAPDTDLWNVQVTVYRQRPDGGKMSVTIGHMIFDPTKRGSTV